MVDEGKVSGAQPIRIGSAATVALISVVLLAVQSILSGGAARPRLLPAPSVYSVKFPAAPEAAYQLGLADRFAGYDQATACSQWSDLPEVARYGLAFVAPGTVPACADKKYVVAMAGAHMLTERTDGPLINGHTRIYAMGSPHETDMLSEQSYSCDDIQQLVATYSFPAHPFPVRPEAERYQASDEWLALYKSWEIQRTWVDYANRMYDEGGDFPEGCYPPTVVFGPDNQMTFFPNQPVHSLRESAAPVFHSPEGSTMIGVGPVYRIVPGDTLGSIATCFYGWSGWEVLAFANNIADVRTLQIGQEIHIPGVVDTARCKQF